MSNLAGFSDSKVERNSIKHVGKIDKQLKHFRELLSSEFDTGHELLIGDGKVRHLYYEMTGKTHMNMKWCSGTDLDNNYLTIQVNRHIRLYSNLTISIWFGTCELTRFTQSQRRGYIDLAPNFYTIVTTLSNKYNA